MSEYIGVIIKQISTDGARDISATSRYMQKLITEGHKTPVDDLGILSGSMNCVSQDRHGQLREIDNYLKLHGNLKSSQAASHQIISYPQGFIPTRLQIERDVKILLQKYGMQDHPVIWDVHNDTNNIHIHLLISRVSLTPDKSGKYLIADNGFIKTKTTKEKTKSGKTRIRGPRTDWASCRQSAIHVIGEAYGWPPPENLRCTKEGKLIKRSTQKDNHSDGTRIKERKTGKKSKQRQLAEVSKEIFDKAAIEHKDTGARFWAIADRMFAEKVIEITIKFFDDGKPGGILTGPDNRKCSFSKCGKKYSARSLVEKYGLPSNNDGACPNEYSLQPFEYKDLLTPEEIKKRLLPIFKNAENWDSLIDTSTEFGKIKRSGGGLVFVFNNNSDTIKFSEISNKYSLSRLEKVFGQCPLPKTKFEAQEEYQAKLIEELIEQPETQQVRYIPKIPLLSQIKQQQFTKEYHYVAGILGKPEQPKQQQPEQQPMSRRIEPRPTAKKNLLVKHTRTSIESIPISQERTVRHPVENQETERETIMGPRA
ncbi:relaxase/mobilization nuclease domain-containing protein [Desulfovibrio litoralis]|uniref:Relaxase/Mobilisation nuclease domain-containing protein n=1 Tax=Desulfovibrio litoralis DSM 11393 TaxID=1121455 RepID=A0A1M7TLX5_9BACT|nr:relaxase/mobilization nuclease domain-containing protein [Desulfovibrio litoralis]SHN71715.1 Relaxase/Mobilisation nuclease domain-containing protein [Desulfovibrio litoralis DSM 11393]